MKVFARLNGGMGNQMFQYAYAHALAERHRASLVLDRSLFELPQTPENYRLDEFALDPVFSSARRNLLHRILLSPKIPRAVRAALMRIMGTRVLCEGDPAPVSVVLRLNSLLLDGYFQKPNFFAEQAGALRDAFLLRIEGDLAMRTLERIENSCSVAVHVRRGDYASNAHFRELLGVLSKDYYLTAIGRFQARFATPRFFFFSDEPQWVEDALLSEVDSGEVVSLGKEAKDTTEMALMTACKHFIIANSTFSWWPAFLGDERDKCVIAPSPWFRGAESDLVMPDWETMPPIWEV